MKRCTVIYNPNSGKGVNKKTLNKLLEIFNKYDIDVTFIKSEYKGHIKQLVKNIISTDLVISIGGDGTFNEAMTGNFERKKRLLMSHLPVGTTNDIGNMYGYGKDLCKNLELLLNGCIKKIDLCKINNQVFTYSAGIGKFISVSTKTPSKLKRKYGYLAYLLEGFKELVSDNVPLYNLTYKVNGDTYKGKYSFLLISNANRIAGINDFYKEIKLDDYTFEVLFCDITDKKQIIRSLFKLATADITKAPGFKFYKTSRLNIKFDASSLKEWTVDGEEYNDLTDEFEINIIKDIDLLIPEKNISKLFVNKDINYFL